MMDEQRNGRRADDLKNAAIESILEVTSDFQYIEDVDLLLQKICKTVSETFGLAKCTIGIREKDTGLFAVRAAYGFEPEMETKIRKVKYTLDRMMRDLKPEFKVSTNTYYIPSENWEPDDEDMVFVAHPERLDRARRFPDEWTELDYIDLLMKTRDGDILGYLEIDEPDDHKVPSDEKLRAIEIFSDLAAIAIQNAELYEDLENDRKKIELLIDLIGHDVNNYAQAVSGFVELAMSRKGVPEPSRKNLAKALDQVWNLNKLINNVKLFAKVEIAADKDLKPLDIVAVVREAFAAAASFSPSKQSKLKLLNDDGKPRKSMMNDLAKDVFLNLFTNAIKFDINERVEIEVEITEHREEKRTLWCVSVADNGPGVDDALKPIIFDRFTRASTFEGGSSGLGLHIAQTIVNSYKGRIWVEDRVPGDHTRGSVFRVLLPKAAEKA
jgi:signal transduction histidine kinase